ncbi:MAG: hypothetical protein V3R87_10370 [Dehalococcoidia bacterium]
MQQIRLVVFAILMESRGGVVEKSPRDIALAWQTCMKCRTVEQFLAVLDHNDALKLKRWLARFGKRLAG